MNLSTLLKGVFVLVAFVLLLIFFGAFYTVSEMEMVIITRFGETRGQPITDAGLHFKTPFVDTVNRLDKRVLEWDGPRTEMPTKDKLYIIVDSFARWQITDPTRFFTSFGDIRRALSRLDDIIGSETRNTVARHELVELIRSTHGREPIRDEGLTAAHGLAPAVLPQITSGRVALEAEITKEAKRKLADLGIELLDVRFKRINYNPTVANKIYDRMMSERRQIAELFRSEGAGEAAKIQGTRERDVRRIESEAYAKAQIVQGKADAEAISIYAQAFNSSAEAREFFTFQRSLEVYKTSFTRDTTLVLTTGDGFLQYLKGKSFTKSSKAATTAPSPPAPPATPAAQ